jgi:hypothetical protein
MGSTLILPRDFDPTGENLGVLQPALQHGVTDDRDATGQPELPYGVRLVHLDGFNADVELARDLLITVAQCNQPQNRLFAIGDRDAVGVCLSGMSRRAAAAGRRRTRALPLPHRSRLPLESLVADVDEGIEEALWNAIRALEEATLLLERMSAALPLGDNDADALAAKAKELRRQSDEIRKISSARTVLTTAD